MMTTLMDGVVSILFAGLLLHAVVLAPHPVAARLEKSSASASSSLTASAVANNDDENPDVLRIPLIPHRVQERRRRRRLEEGPYQQEQQEEQEEEKELGRFEWGDDELFDDVTVPADRPQRYYKRETMSMLRSRGLHGEEAEPTKYLTVGALYQGYGTHYADLWVGSPPQRQTVIVDTGSGVTAFPCSACTDCGMGHHVDNFFVEANSSTFQKVPCGHCHRGSCRSKNSDADCRIGMSYQEGSSWSAYEAQDLSYIGGPHNHGLRLDEEGDSDIDPHHARAFAFDLMFGCQTHLTGLFKTQLADGIMGQDHAATSFWSQMHSAGKMKSRQFSLCFSRQPTADKDGTESGAMTMGGFDRRLHKSPLVFTSDKDSGSGHGMSSAGFFSVHLRKIYLRQGGGGDSAVSTNPNLPVKTLEVSESELNRGNVIVDSGTTDSYFTRKMSSAFSKAFQEMTGGKSYSHTPESLTKRELDALPTILFQLAGDVVYNQNLFQDDDASDIVGLAKMLDPDHPYDVILAMPPSHYMEWDRKQQKYIARFYTDEGSGSVIGANAMMGHDIFFDVDNHRIGFAESDCDYTKLLIDNNYDVKDVLPPPQPEPAPAPQPPAPVTPKNSVDGNTSENGEQNNEQSNEQSNNGEHDWPDPHDEDKPSDDIKKSPSKFHPAVEACSDYACRGSLLGASLLFCFMGICCGRLCRGSNGGIGGKDYHDTELEVPTVHNGDGIRYRDHPSDGIPASNGYHDDPPKQGFKDEPDDDEDE